MAKDNLPALGLSINVQTTSGSGFQLHPSDPDPGRRPLGINWRTKLGEGFSDGGVNFALRVDDDHYHIGLMDIWTVVSDDGDVLYEGRVEGQPRSLDDRHSVGVTLVGRMADAKRRKFCEIYVDRRRDAWGTNSFTRQADLATYKFHGHEVLPDAAGSASIKETLQGPWTSAATSEAVYDGRCDVGSVYYEWQQINSNFAAFDWGIAAYTSDRLDGGSILNFTGDLQAAGPGSGTLTVTAAGGRYVRMYLQHGAPNTTGTSEHAVYWKNPAVYGRHGLTTYAPLTTGQPNGVRATDALKDIVNRYCSGLNATGVQDSDYVIPHLAFTERTYPYDAFLQINKYLLWKLAVWEDGAVVFEPHDLTDYTWQIRTDDPNVKLEWQGPSTGTIYNGVAVTFDNLLTGRREEITPDDRDDLADPDPENPFNKASVPQWLEVTLSTPQLEDDAAAIGVAELAEANRPKAPGTFYIRGHIKDRAGNWQHVGKVRAGETIAITSQPDQSPIEVAPRLIVETDYQDDSKQLRVATDMPFQLVEAIMDRVDVELQAAGLR